MTNKIVEPKAISAANLRLVFEAAVEDIHHTEPLTPRVRYGAPIVPRRIPATSSQGGGEKRALTDAARALAQLWKLPATVR
jgi:hypothetical protein